jgi:hypothetical protein
MKIIVATILLRYRVALDDGAVERPQNRIISGVILPDGAARLKFIKRDDAPW